MKSLKYWIYLLGVLVFGAIGYRGVSVIEDFLDRAPCISVNGLSDRIIMSDVAKWTISIINDADSLKEIQEKRKSDKTAVGNLLLQLGFSNEEIKEGTTSVVDQLNDMKRDEGKKKYRIVDTITMESRNVELVEKSISEVSKLVDDGIRAEGSVSYHCKNLDEIRVSMIEEATKDAINRAERIANSSNVTLSKLRNISTGTFTMFPEDASSERDYSSWDESERTARKRIRVVAHATFDLKS
ncbi:MAG: SIMPL domain-containing protein [Holosporales bacterium]|jgi:hypothetical protein|nr:SIMPL domain-containing protein [Holosporales bacterium]